MSKFPAFRLISWLLCCPVCFVPACGGSDDGSESNPELGALSLPLVTNVNGHSYRLSGSLSVLGNYYAWFELAGDSEVLSVPLNTGSYVARLDYWQLSRDDGTGNFVNVPSSLVSGDHAQFRIYAGTSSTIAFTFETDGVLVRVGSGNLDVRVNVEEIAPLCEPFAAGCGEGAWCPSAELTGAPRACVAAGVLALGTACSGPLDCVADSSCFDFGSGAACTALCPATLFGQPCSEATECIPAGSDYGICTPVLPEAE
jgi:hypothetical protein